MTPAKGLITVWLHVAPQYEEEFNARYDLEHVPEMLRVPGVQQVRRYAAENATPKFLAWYDVADDTVEPGPGFQRVTQNPTPWSQRIRRLYGEHRERMNFRLLCDVGETAVHDAPWLYIVHTDIPDGIVDEYNAWYDAEHLPRCVTVPGVLRARRYNRVSGPGPRYLTAYELSGPDVWESPAARAARKTPWTEKMRSLFTNTRRSLCRRIAPVAARLPT